MDNQVTKVEVTMSQKINLGNYETRDYSVGLELTKSEGQTTESVMKFGKDLCAKEVGEYYRKIKTEMSQPKKEEIELLCDEDKGVIERIKESEDIAELDALKNTQEFKDIRDKKVVYNVYNDKKIKLNEINIS